MYKYRELKTCTAYIGFRSDQSKFLNPLRVIHFYIVIFFPMAEKELKFRQLGAKKPQKRPERAHMYKSGSPGSGSPLCSQLALCSRYLSCCYGDKMPDQKET